MKIKKIFSLLVPAVLAATMTFPACDDVDDGKTNWERYADWRNQNETWIQEQIEKKDASGKALFTKYSPIYNSQVQFLMRFIGDPAANTGNLQPMYTSTATVNYTVHLCDGTRIDSSYHYTSQLSSQYLINGWSEIITRMHVGDSVEAILPYTLGYGQSGTTGVPPYSALRFNVKLVDVPNYETRP